jgi:hypothetical protein
MPTAKPAVVALNTAHAFAQHLLLMVPFVEGSGQPGVVRGADGVTAGAPTTTVWTGTPATWTTNSAGACVSGVGATPLQIGADATSGAWLPTGDCTICLVVGKSSGVVSGGFTVKSISGGAATTLSLAVPRNNNNVQWAYGTSGSGNPIEGGSAGGWAADPPDKVVVTAGAAGFAIYKNGTKVTSSATARSRSSSTTSLVLMGLTGGTITYTLNFFQISAMQWDDATAAAWAADPYAHLVAATTVRQLGLTGVGS